MLTTPINRHGWSYWCLLFCTLTMSIALPVRSQEENLPDVESNTQTQIEEVEEEGNTVRPVNQIESLLSLQSGENLMKEAREAINGEQYELAASKLQQARRIFNQLSNFYLQLADSFSGIDNRIAESQRAGALRTAALRDEATYQLALVHRAQNQAELAVPLLIQIIRSQNPTSELGKKSYQQLYEIGFVDAPFQTSSN
jgi:thioredoxin-like negative regulator of GroEL